MPEESHSSHCHRHRHHHHQHQDSMGDESPRLSVDSSLSSHDPTLAEYCSLLGVEHSEDERPVSAVSTLSSTSSGEGQSSPFRGPILASSRPSPPTGPDIDLELSPPEEREEPSTLLKPGSRRPKQDPSEDQCNHNVSSTGARTPPQNSDTPSPIATEAMAPNPQLTYVDRVVMEIIETERMYVQDLCSIVEDYLAYIIDARDLPIKPEQVSSLFGNIEVIYEFNSELLQCLEMCHSDPVAIACCFVDKSQYFNIYTQYCTNYPNSVATLTECMRNKTLAKFFRDRQASLERSLPLGAYLLKPVQRILKYHLLLQEIVKHFDPEEDGYDVVEEAIDTMTGVAWYINDMKRKHEHAVRLQEIQSLLLNWKGPDLTTYGELVLEGTFHVHRAKNERTLFLFDKMLLITKKRGEHYVYKTHITCSTLMLIESAKDSLRFSVTHYKHPKQPHTVQAKTVEEKKLWAHHIKRLILENHHAIIPQKAKDAILDMSSSGPVKYRYSPERLKKPLSFQNEDFPAGGRKGRRRSEPMKQSVKNTKGTLKHADSVGTLLADSSHRPLQTAASISTLSSSLGEPEVERPALQETRAEWLHLRTNSLDRLSATDLEARRLEMPFQREEEEKKEREVEEEQGGSGEEEEKILVKDEQVADFASSVLAAISCWHYRAKALLFTRVPTYGDEEEPSEENELGTKRSQTPSEDEQDLGLCEQDSSGDYCSQSFSLAEGTEESRGQQPPLHPEMSQDVDMECEETVESSMDSSSPIHNESQLEDKGPPSSRNLTEDVEDLEEEDDEEEEEDVLLGTEPTSILPTSVLDKASDIAERFISSLSRRSSLVVDDMYSIGCHSSCTGSRRSSLLGLNADLLEKEKIHELNCYSPELHAVIPMAEPSASSTVTDRLATPDQRPPNKQDTLSKKDRMLIHKIKQYYEHAEHQDANFSIKRRESLSYIPAGLVRNLSRQINGLPTDEDIAVYKKVSSASRPTSWAVFNLPGLDKERNTMAKHTNLPATVDGNDAMVRSPVGGENEDFQPSAEMLRVWKDMEVEVVEGSESHQDTGKDGLYDVRPNQKQKRRESSDDECGEPLLILEESDNSMAGQGSLTPSPVSNHTWKDPELELRPNSENMLQERHRVRHAPLPKIISLRSGSEEDLILQDMEKMKNKVFQLARQYSQRIKNSRPVVKQRARVPESHFGPTNLASLVEDKSPVHEKGLRSIILPHGSCEHTEHSPSHSPSSLDSPRLQSPSRAPSLSPQSPVYTENFHWPAVRELRSKYSRRGTQPLSVTRSCSVPDRILETALSDHKAQRSCSCSTPVYGSSTPTKATAASCYESQGPAGQTATKLCKANSVDYMMAPLNLNYISGEDTQPNDNKVIIVERIIGEQSGESGFAGEEKKEETGENHLRWDPDLELPARIKDRNHDSRLQTWLDGSRTYPLRSLGKTETSQHSLVKNLREKFQNLSSHT
ncbi:pleckstrin homology domain-containing family G member 3 isoform X1 [Pygocentrus nattereri]|uniref:pleckstrin homology domain-containing family G member 3 isoform X1 n=1 Tax=Pygocentrus nattereri TaxID=42514 RepID=UPI000814392F|nr:pleckstrin homology domain-containing family G member 3 isoform X1 [Pygocentrus nattereri]